MLGVPQSIIILTKFRSVKNLDLLQPVVVRIDVRLSIFTLFENFVAHRERANIMPIGLAHNVFIPIDREWDRNRVIPVPMLAGSFAGRERSPCAFGMVARVVFRHWISDM